MVRKIVCAVIAVVLIATAVVLLPGGFRRLWGKDILPSPAILPESTLTVEETAIAPDDIDPTWVASTSVYVSLEGENMTVRGAGVSLSEDGRVLTIRQKGTYIVSGELYDGQIVVDVTKGRVRIVLANASIHCERSAPIYVRSASKVCVIAEAGTVNQLSDGASYAYDDPMVMEPDATIFSTADLVFCGTGALTVNGNFRDAIYSRDRLIIADMTLSVKAKEDGVIGHDALLVRDATIEADCGRDCLKSNQIKAGLGYVYLESGIYSLTAGTDGISATDRMLIAGGVYHLLCGGGYVMPRGLESRKGIKAASELVITGGDFEIDASDDALHADGRMAITGGEFSLYSGDDALLATTMYIGGGELIVRTCLEGMVAEKIEIIDGEIRITSQMDGINARIRAAVAGEGFHLYPSDAVVAPSAAALYITGGRLIVNADRDAVCVRGTMHMSGGLVLLAGPESSGGDPIDCDVGFTMTGGTLVASGRTTYIPALTAQSTVSVLETTFSTFQTADIPIVIRCYDEVVITAISPRSYYKLVVFSSLLQEGSVYTLCAGVKTASDVCIWEGEGVQGDRAMGSFMIVDGRASLCEIGKLFPNEYYEEEIL